MIHDTQCEQAPGGAYFGRTVQHSNPPMAIPCHCPARADGAARAAREMAR